MKINWVKYILLFSLLGGLLFGYNNCVMQPKVNSKKNLTSKNQTNLSNENPQQTTNDQNNVNDGNQNLDSLSGQLYFNETIIPLFEQKCAVCHADPRFNPPIQGPLSIFNYSSMKSMLGEGSAKLANGLYLKIQNITSHQGGNRCIGNDVEVCNKVLEWWEQEFSGEMDSGSSLSGEIQTIGKNGKIYGIARNLADLNSAIAIKVFVNGQINTGNLIGTASANLSTNSGHGFEIDIPDQYRDGTRHELYLYGSFNGQDYLLDGPVEMFSYLPKQDGRNFYEQTIRPQMVQSCSGCHVVNYEVHYSSLSTELPYLGGSATNLSLIHI